MKITAKFRAWRRLRFEDTKRIMSPEMSPKSFGTFEKQAPDPYTVTVNIICVGLLLLVLSLNGVEEGKARMEGRQSADGRKAKRGWKEGDMTKKWLLLNSI